MDSEMEEGLKLLRALAKSSITQVAADNNVKSFNEQRPAMESSWETEMKEFLEGQKKVPNKLRLRHTAHPYLTKIEKGKANAYAGVVKKLNEARLKSLSFNPAYEFRAAYLSLDLKEATGKVRLADIWNLVLALTGEHTISRERSLILRSKGYLERIHENYIMSRISEEPVLAALGGGVLRLERIHAFLRVHLKDYGVLDFDATDACYPPPFDTTWQQIYFCMRTGYYDEARIVAASSNTSQEFSPLLNEWITTGGMVSGEIAAKASNVLGSILRTSHFEGGAGYEKEQLLLYALISGSRTLFHRLQEDQPTLFDTEDSFYWFTLSSIRDFPVGAASTVMNAGLEPYTLMDFQASVNSSSPGTYTTNGADPLMYPYVLLLSIQLMPAIEYLSDEIGGQGYDIDAAHMMIALADHGVLPDVVGAGHGVGVTDAYKKASGSIKQYGSKVHFPKNLPMVLEYHAQAAAVCGGGRLSWARCGTTYTDQQRQRVWMLKHVVTEMLMRADDITFLLGTRGKEGELARFFPNKKERIQFLHEAAKECQIVGLLDKYLLITGHALEVEDDDQ